MNMQAHEDSWSKALQAERLGNQVAYAGFLSELVGVLRGVVGYRLAPLALSTDELEDVVQEVLIAIHERRRQWDPARPLIPWLNAIVRYKAIDTVRRLRRQRLRHVVLDETDWANVPDTASEPVSGRDVERMVGQLPTGQQSVVRALGMDGASAEEAARRLGISEGAVRVAFHRGLKRLKQAARNWS